MLYLSVGLCVVACLSILWTTWVRHKANTRYEHNVAIAGDLKKLAMALHEEKESQQKIQPSTYEVGDEPNDLSSPAMLATLVTVLVSKLGNVRLGLADFALVDDDAFVSVYVDTNTQEILLSMDPALTETGPDGGDIYEGFGSFGAPDDTTFH